MAGLKRVQFWMTPKQKKNLDDLKESTEAPSNSEVVKKALAVYAAVLTEVEAGNALLTRDIDGKIQPFWGRALL